MSSGDLPGSSVAILLHLRRASNAQLQSRRCQAQMAFLHTPRPAFGAQAHLSLSLKCCANASSKVLLSSALSMRALAVSACMALGGGIYRKCEPAAALCEAGKRLQHSGTHVQLGW